MNEISQLDILLRANLYNLTKIKPKPHFTQYIFKSYSKIKKLPRVGVGDSHLYITTSSQWSVMTEDYCAAPLRSLVKDDSAF